ncbi:PIN domain-containing protein [Microbacterium gorillae]|uniref:PIN domain-containing protein n=1 Tax=Microbacterium gorillae TaxID=1231063 RepID=UPI003D9686E3
MISSTGAGLCSTSVVAGAWLAKESGQKLLELAAKGNCVVVYPQVVIDELRRQSVERAHEAHDSAAGGLAEIGESGVDVNETAAALAAVLQRIESDIDSAFTGLLDRPGVTTAPVPGVAAAALLRRDLERRRPFMEIEHGGKNKKKSVGFRDVLIWETVLELAAAGAQYEVILFATSDNGFIDTNSRSLHPDLLGDLDALGVRAGVVDRVDSLLLVIAKVESAMEEASAREPEGPTAVSSDDILKIVVDELRGPIPSKLALVTAATEALYELEGKAVEMQMGYGGDYDYPEFVKFTVPAFESSVITSIDQTSQFTFEESSDSPDVLVGTANAIITLEGGVHKGDWFADDEHRVEITGELNDRYFEASSEVAVRAAVALDIEGGDVTVVGVELEDDTSLQNAAEDQLAFETLDASDDENDSRPAL